MARKRAIKALNRARVAGAFRYTLVADERLCSVRSAPQRDTGTVPRVEMRLAVFVLSSLVVAFFASVNVARADPCKPILDEIKTLSDRANRELESSAANLQEAASEVPDDKRRIALIAR